MACECMEDGFDLKNNWQIETVVFVADQDTICLGKVHTIKHG